MLVDFCLRIPSLKLFDDGTMHALLVDRVDIGSERLCDDQCYWNANDGAEQEENLDGRAECKEKPKRQIDQHDDGGVGLPARVLRYVQFRLADHCFAKWRKKKFAKFHESKADRRSNNSCCQNESNHIHNSGIYKSEEREMPKNIAESFQG